jgi:uncharacterized membrane protein YqjE
MRIGAQPHRARGTIDHPYSALNLRLVLAGFGLISCSVLAVVALRVGSRLLGLMLIALAAIAAIDLVVIQLRRRQRRRTEGGSHSLFE